MFISIRVFGYVLAMITLSSALFADESLRNKMERIKLSLRQPTLIQTMTSSACMTMGGIDAQSASNAALDDLDTYKTVIASFSDGHEWLGLLPENDTVILGQLDALGEVWSRYRPAVQQLVAGDYHAVVMSQLLTQNDEMTEASNALAAKFIAHYGSDAVDADVGRALQQAAHHMMLSQRSIMEMCYAYFGIGGAEMPRQLAGTIQAVDTGFADLSAGAADGSFTPNARVKRNLRTAALFWDRVKTAAEPLARGEAIAQEDLEKALKMNKSVLKQLNQALESYLVGL